RPSPPTLFPYTTLFRSDAVRDAVAVAVARAALLVDDRPLRRVGALVHSVRDGVLVGVQRATGLVHRPATRRVGTLIEPFQDAVLDRKSTRLNSSHEWIS